MRILALVSLLALVVLLSAAARLGRLERGGPPHADVFVAPGVPATVYLPEVSGDASFGLGDVPPREARPPAVVLVHGFAADRRNLSSLARRLARGGYAVLALDLAGHGENRHPYERGRASAGAFVPELSAAVDFLRTDPYVDGSRLALVGHSMGAMAALDYATRDAGLTAVVLVSGGVPLEGPHTPPSTLLLYAAAEPRRIRARVERSAAQLAGVAAAEPGRTYGDPASGAGVRLVEIPGTDHGSIVFSGGTARETLAWLDASFGVERERGDPPPDPRLTAAAGVVLALPFVFAGLGAAVGRLAPRGEELPPGGAGVGVLVLAGALVATLPLLGPEAPGAFLSLEVADFVVSHLALAGLVLIVALSLTGRAHPASAARDLGRAFPAAAVAVTGVYAALFPLAPVLHRLALTPERAALFPLAALGALPFACAFQLLIRRSGPLAATAWSLLGRFVILAVLVLGVRAGALPSVVGLMIPALAVVFVLFEVLASALYVTSRNRAAIAWIDAFGIALVGAATMPIRI